MSLLLSVLEQGMIYAIMALGVYITYKILDFPDLTVDGSFPMGAAITCILISKGMNPILTLFISFAAGVLVGILTGVIHVKLKVRDLLSGIIMMTALYTVNLRIAGRANLPIYNNETIFDNALVNGIFAEGRFFGSHLRFACSQRCRNRDDKGRLQHRGQARCRFLCKLTVKISRPARRKRLG